MTKIIELFFKNQQHYFRKKMALGFFFSLFLLFTVFNSCKKENRCDCIKRTGTIITETRAISNFDKIYVEDNINVFITQNSTFGVKVEAGKNIVPLIKTDVKEGTLFIKNDNRCNWTRSYDKALNIYIEMPVIKYITSDGTGKIQSLNTITTDVFDVQTKNSGNIELTINNSQILSHMHGAGDLTLRGVTNEHLCDIGGTAFLRCKDLQTSYTWIHTFTTGLCYISATNVLICNIDKIGDVYCYGSPATVQKSQKGAGQLYLK